MPKRKGKTGSAFNNDTGSKEKALAMIDATRLEVVGPQNNFLSQLRLIF